MLLSMYQLLTSAPDQSFGALLKGKLVKLPSMLPAPRASHWLAGKSQPSVTEPPNFCCVWGCCSNSRFNMRYRSRVKREIIMRVCLWTACNCLKPDEPKLSTAQQTVLHSPTGKLRAYWLFWGEYHNPSSLYSEIQKWTVMQEALWNLWSLIQKKEVLSCSVRNVHMS